MIQFNYPRILPFGENAEKRKTLRLYMYVTAESLFAILKSGKLKLSHPWKTNDITECLAQNELGLRYDIKKFGYLCFSSDPTSPAMWGYYAERGKGACLVFDFDVIEVQKNVFELVFDGTLDVDHPIYVRKVMYGETRCPRNTKGDEFFCKSKEWEHEEEYRIVLDLDNEAVDVEAVHTVREVSLAHYFNGLLNYMCGVILGPRFVGEETEIKSYLKHCFPKKMKEYICEDGLFHLGFETLCSARYANVHRAILHHLNFQFVIPIFETVSHAETSRKFKRFTALSNIKSVGICRSVDLARIANLFFEEKNVNAFAAFSVKLENGGQEKYAFGCINGKYLLIREEKPHFLIELDYPLDCLEHLNDAFVKALRDEKPL